MFDRRTLMKGLAALAAGKGFLQGGESQSIAATDVESVKPGIGPDEFTAALESGEYAVLDEYMKGWARYCLEVEFTDRPFRFVSVSEFEESLWWQEGVPMYGKGWARQIVTPLVCLDIDDLRREKWKLATHLRSLAMTWVTGIPPDVETVALPSLYVKRQAFMVKMFVWGYASAGRTNVTVIQPGWPSEVAVIGEHPDRLGSGGNLS